MKVFYNPVIDRIYVDDKFAVGMVLMDETKWLFGDFYDSFYALREYYHTSDSVLIGEL